MDDTKKKSNVKIAVLGGDLRQLTAADELIHDGNAVSLYGFDTYRESLPLPSVLEEAEAVLLPVPVLRGEYLNLPLSDAKITPLGIAEALERAPLLKVVIGGKMPELLCQRLQARGISCLDLCENETFNLLNAVPTAEGALAIAMNHTPVTIRDSRVAVLGYGRIGRYAASLFLSLGASVTAVARKERDRTEAEMDGCRSCDYPSLPLLAGEFDLIVNTVPSVVVTKETLDRMKKTAFIIDLASKPGGVDTAAALRSEVRVITALSLPGKVAPVSAGRIIARCVGALLKEADL